MTINLEEYIKNHSSNLNDPVVIGFYKKNPHCAFSKLCDLHGSDKGSLSKEGRPYTWAAHSYADFYASLFRHCKNNIFNVFECGLGTNNPDLASSMGVNGRPGASLRVWRDYFPNANIIGADIDKDILFEESRIKTFYVDQLNPSSIKELWSRIETKSFDLMIDDGLHSYDAGKTLFENSIQKLSFDGIYIIEDVNPDSLKKFMEYFLDKNFHVEYFSLLRPYHSIMTDNNIVVIRNI